MRPLVEAEDRRDFVSGPSLTVERALHILLEVFQYIEGCR
jgi:hypothetical protein